MDSLNRDVIRKIALNLDIQDVYHLCLTSTLFNKHICNDDTYWLERVRVEFPYAIHREKDETWKKIYQRLNPSRVIRVNYFIEKKVVSEWIGRDRITGENFYQEIFFDIPHITKNGDNIKQISFKFSSASELLQIEIYRGFPKYLVFIEGYPETASLVILNRNDGRRQIADFKKLYDFLKGKEVSFIHFGEDIYEGLELFEERMLRNRRVYIIVNGERLSMVGIELPQQFSDLQ